MLDKRPCRPIARQIRGKRFIDCELLGPASIALFKDNHLNGVNFVNCDFVVMRMGVFIRNVIAMDDVQIIGGTIWDATIFVPPGQQLP